MRINEKAIRKQSAKQIETAIVDEQKVIISRGAGASGAASVAETNQGAKTGSGMRKNRQPLICSIMSWTLYCLVFLMPLFILPFLSDPVEYAKQILLFVGTFILALCYALKIATSGKLEFRFGASMLGALALLVVWLLASLFSLFPYNSFLGLGGQQMFSFSSLAAFMLLAFVVSQSFSLKQNTRALYAFFASALVVATVGILQILGLFMLPWDFTKNASFSTVGNFDIAGIVIALALVLATIHIIRLSVAGTFKSMYTVFYSAYIIAMLGFLVVLNDWRLWLIIIVSVSLALVYLYIKLPADKKVGWALLPGFVVIFSATMIVAHPQTFLLPTLIQPSLKASGLIALETMKASPIFGYGPGNFISSFTKFRPAENNKDNYLGLWAARFDQAGSFLFSAVAGTGLVGIFGMLVFALLFLYSLASRLVREPFSDENLALLVSGAGVIALGTAGLLKPSSMAVSFLFWLFVGMCALQMSKKTQGRAVLANQFLIFSSLALYVLISAGIAGALFFGKRVGADVAFAKALALDKTFSAELIEKQTRPDAQRVSEFLATLSRATAGEPYNPVYARTLSKALAYRLNELVGSQEQQNPETTAQIQNITALMIQAAKSAYDANPQDIRNIENISEAYQQVAPYAQGADSQAIEYLKKASEQDPTNPSHELAQGRFLLTMSVIRGERVKSAKAEQQEIKTSETEAAAKALADAEQALQRAIALKSDYPEALYAMSMARTLQKNNNGALEFLDKAMIANANLYALQSADASLFLSLGSSYQGLGEKEKAETAYKNALLMNPQFAGAKWQLALLYVEQGKNADALALLEELRKNEPNNETIAAKIQEIQGVSQNSGIDESGADKTAEPTEQQE